MAHFQHRGTLLASAVVMLIFSFFIFVPAVLAGHTAGLSQVHPTTGLNCSPDRYACNSGTRCRTHDEINEGKVCTGGRTLNTDCSCACPSDEVFCGGACVPSSCSGGSFDTSTCACNSYVRLIPSSAQSGYISVSGTGDFASAPIGSVYYRTGTSSGLRVKAASTGAAADWQSVGASYSAGRNVDATSISSSTIAVVGSPSFDKLTLGTAADVNDGDFGLSGDIYLNSGRQLVVNDPTVAGAAARTMFTGPSGRAFGLAVNAAPGYVGELLFAEEEGDQWSISKRTPSDNLEIWRNNGGWGTAPVLSAAFSDGALNIPTRLSVGNAAPRVTAEGLTVEGNLTVGGTYSVRESSTTCPDEHYYIDLDNDGIVDDYECYNDDSSPSAIFASGILGVIGQGQITGGLTLGPNSLNLNTTDARRTDYLLIRNMDNDDPNSPEPQHAIRVIDEDSNEWFSVRKDANAPIGESPTVTVSTSGAVSANSVSALSASFGTLALSSTGTQHWFGGLELEGRLTADQFGVFGTATYDLPPTVPALLRGRALYSGLDATAQYLLRFETYNSTGTRTDRFSVNRDGAIVAGGNLILSQNDDISYVAGVSALAGGTVQIGNGTRILRLDGNEIATDDTLSLQASGNGDTQIGNDLEIGKDLIVDGIIKAGTSAYDLTTAGGSLRTNELADSDFDNVSEGRLILMAPNGRTCNNVCGSHGLGCDSGTGIPVPMNETRVINFHVDPSDGYSFNTCSAESGIRICPCGG